jgi:hypothetical protein
LAKISFKRPALAKKMKCTRIKMKKGTVIFLSFWVLFPSTLSGTILLDEPPLKKGKILLFKDHNNPNSLYYLSTEIRVASGPDGRPKVSYYQLKGQENVLSFFLTHGLSSEKLNRIRKDLAEENPELTLKGPVSFRSGKFFVFSEKKGKSELWATGRAPLFPNQEVVVTKRLKEPIESDIVVVFVMEYEGITQKINARLSVNWDEVYLERYLSEKTTWTQVEIKESLHRLKESGAIRLEMTEDYGDLAKVWSIAYEHLMHQMFDVQEFKINEQAALRAESRIGHQNLIYTLKKERKSGSYLVDFNRRFRDKRQIIIVSDIGGTIKETVNSRNFLIETY